jgi:hypothetical protein
MIVALNTLKTATRSEALNSWFASEERPAATKATAAVDAARQLLSWVQIKHSLASIKVAGKRNSTSVPELPRFARQDTAPARVPLATDMPSPYQMLQQTLSPHSRSSQWLKQFGWLEKFTSNETFVDIKSSSDGSYSASLRSPDGWRRTIVCRADGTCSQRITTGTGIEVLRFTGDGEPVRPSESKQSTVPAIA